MQWFFLLIILLGLGYLAANAFVGANPQALARSARLIGGFGAIGLGVALSLFGRVIFGAPLVLFGLMMLGRRLSLGGIGGRRSAGQASRVRTATVEMTLDHDTGEIDGQVLAGAFAGRALSALGLADLLDLRGQCLARDPKAAQLVDAYLDRAHADWRKSAGEGAGEGASAPDGGPMSREEAYEILGLGPGCSADDVRRAHRQLMKKLHPDRGGSTYLAAKVNEAKDLLLGRR